MRGKNKDKKDIEYLNQFVKKNLDAIATPTTTWIALILVGVITSGLPLGLFFTSYYSVESWLVGAPYFTIGLLASSTILALTYDRWAVKERLRLQGQREPDLASLKTEVRQALEKSTFIESTSIAIFSQNVVFFLFYLFWSAYIFPSYGFDDKHTYALSTILASTSSLGFGYVYHSVKL